MLSITLMLAGCGHLTSPRPSPRGEGEACRTLMGIDSLMWQQPDSAFALLLDFAESPEADSLDVFNGHYFQLLVAELLYKNDYEQTNRPELLRAVACFDSLVAVGGADARGVSVWPFQRRDASNASAQTTAFLAARAHYINGVGYYERDSVVEACEEYMKTLETMEEHFEEEELTNKRAQFMALTYTRLADLYSDLYLHEQVVYFSKMSLKYFQRAESSPRHLARMLNEIGAQYEMTENLDSAMCYYKKGIALLPDTNSITYRDLAVHYTFLSYEQGKDSLKALERMYQLIPQSANQNEYLSRSLTIGEIYYQEKMYDSAYAFLNRVFYGDSNLSSRKQAAEWLVDICKAQGRDNEILDYASFLVPFANQGENQSEIKSQLTELYKTFDRNRLERQHYKQTIKYAKLTLEVISGMLVVILATSLLYHKNKKHKQHLETLIESERQTHKMQQAALSGRLRRSNEELRDVSNRLEQMLAKDALSESELSDDYSAFVNAPVCLYIVELTHKQQFKSKMDYLVYKSYALNRDQLLALRNAAKQNLPRFISNIHKQYPGLTDSDMDYCCLILLGLNEADISALLQKAYTTVCDRCRKISRIIGTTDSLYHTLHSMLSV